MQNNQQTGAVLPFIQETRSSWDKLKEEQLPGSSPAMNSSGDIPSRGTGCISCPR